MTTRILYNKTMKVDSDSTNWTHQIKVSASVIVLLTPDSLFYYLRQLACKRHFKRKCKWGLETEWVVARVNTTGATGV